MQYGLITYQKRPMKPGRSYMLNIGDPIQTYAMKTLLQEMGISDCVSVSRYHSNAYDGASIRLIYNCWNMIFNQQGHPYGALPLPKQVSPVFISMHLHSREIGIDILEQFKKNPPVGCRDEETLKNLQKNGVDAWLSGCVTMLLPRRERMPKKKKVFLVDIPESVRGYIPSELLKDSVVVHHQRPYENDTNSDFMSDDLYRRFYNDGIAQLEQYKEEASLVVTSRLHAAAPCIAMGIPVIVVSERFDGRFSFLDKLVPLYTKEQFHCIDWNPDSVDFEVFKVYMKKVFQKCILGISTCEERQIVTKFWSGRTTERYDTDLKHTFAQLKWDTNGKGKYAIWGINSQSLRILNYIKDHYPNWKCVKIIDNSVTGMFEGMLVEKCIDRNLDETNIFYFVIPESAHAHAKQIFCQRNIPYALMKNCTLKEWNVF